MKNNNYSLNIIQKYKIKPIKKFSQNFLIDEEILKKITNLINLKNKKIIEIGPGIGNLTFFLLKEAKEVMAYEIDIKMIKILEKEIQNSKFILKKENFINTIFDWKTKRILIANMPYHLTTKILFKLFWSSQYFSQIILMVQDEVAKRLTAKSNTKHYGKLTVAAQYFCSKIDYKFQVLAKSFIPEPKVNSAIILIKFKKEIIQNNDFLNFVTKCFHMQRKTLHNNLKIFLSKEQIDIILKLLKNKNCRPQEISYKKYMKFYNALK